MTRLILIIAATLLAPTAVLAQSSPASSTMTVENALTVAPTAPVRLKPSVVVGAPVAEGAALADAPTVVMVSGDPNRVYRVRIPNASAYGDPRGVRIVSDNAGDVSELGVSRLDALGQDRLEITAYSGVLVEVEGRQTIPLSIVYE